MKVRRLVSGVRAVSDRHAAGVDHDLPAAPQPRLDLPRPSALLQPQGEHVVMATEADQDPLPDVDPLTEQPQGAGAVTEVGPNGEVTLCDLRDEEVIRRRYTLRPV